MKKLLKATVYLILIGTTSNAMALEVFDFKSGIICTDNKTYGFVCHETKDIFVTDQGQCVWNGENKPCTWYGFEFRYKNAGGDRKIDCKFKNSKNATYGNPNEILEDSESSREHSFTLEKDEGIFYNPQYTLFKIATTEGSFDKIETQCFLGNSLLFQYEFNVYLPYVER